MRHHRKSTNKSDEPAPYPYDKIRFKHATITTRPRDDQWEVSVCVRVDGKDHYLSVVGTDPDAALDAIRREAAGITPRLANAYIRALAERDELYNS